MVNHKQQVVNEIHRMARRNFPRRKTYMVGIADTFQADLIEMIPHAKENDNHRYALIVIDIFTKFAWAVPIRSKKGKDVANAMSSILANTTPPRNMQTDAGGEFFSKEFAQLMKRYKIHHYTTYSTKKAAICERFNRTLKNKLFRRMHYNGSYRWVDIIEKIMFEYNYEDKHRTIKMTPSEVNKNNEHTLLQTVYNYKNEIPLKVKFKVGDYVRISKHKGVFDKGYVPNWSTEIFTIAKVRYTNPITYLLLDFQQNPVIGRFYSYELQQVKHPDVYLIEEIIKTKGNKIYVKWLGFDKKFNSWIDKNQIKNS